MQLFAGVCAEPVHFILDHGLALLMSHAQADPVEPLGALRVFTANPVDFHMLLSFDKALLADLADFLIFD